MPRGATCFEERHILRRCRTTALVGPEGTDLQIPPPVGRGLQVRRLICSRSDISQMKVASTVGLILWVLSQLTQIKALHILPTR